MSILAAWADASNIGLPVLAGGVLLGSSVVPLIPTGPLVGSAAALAMTTNRLDLVFVLVIATVTAAAGDLLTFALFRFGGPRAVRLLARRHDPRHVERLHDRFDRRGTQVIVVGHLIPAGRIPVLLAAGALSYPLRRLLPATLLASGIWTVVYMLVGVVSGGIFDSPVAAMLVATGIVLLIGLVANLVSSRRRRTDDEPSADGDLAGSQERR